MAWLCTESGRALNLDYISSIRIEVLDVNGTETAEIQAISGPDHDDYYIVKRFLDIDEAKEELAYIFMELDVIE